MKEKGNPTLKKTQTPWQRTFITYEGKGEPYIEKDTNSMATNR
jgi:hypothetical protein